LKIRYFISIVEKKVYSQKHESIKKENKIHISVPHYLHRSQIGSKTGGNVKNSGMQAAANTMTHMIFNLKSYSYYVFHEHNFFGKFNQILKNKLELNKHIDQSEFLNFYETQKQFHTVKNGIKKAPGVC
jgi:hypothetical protein